MQVRDFSFNEELSHSVISQTCLAYLLQFKTFKSLDVDLYTFFPLANYAAQNWIRHARYIGKQRSQSTAVFMLMMKLLTDENTTFLNWVRLCDIDDYDIRDLQKQRVKIAKPLYYASMAGLAEAACALLEMGVEINAQGGRYGNALQAALYGGHEAIAKLLIENGADGNAQGGYYGNALYAASHRNHEAIAKLLIEKGADVPGIGRNV